MPSSAACAIPEIGVAPDDALRHENRQRAVRLEPVLLELLRRGRPGAERSGAFVGTPSWGARAPARRGLVELEGSPVKLWPSTQLKDR